MVSGMEVRSNKVLPMGKGYIPGKLSTVWWMKSNANLIHKG
jgi:hypothetical protein